MLYVVIQNEIGGILMNRNGKESVTVCVYENTSERKEKVNEIENERKGESVTQNRNMSVNEGGFDCDTVFAALHPLTLNLP